MKKGFTLVEIIISIALIAVIGTIGTIGILNVKEKRNLSRLNHITQDIYEAANLFVETNEEIKEKMYSSKNAVAISLEKLESEGLLDFADIDIDGHYVLTFLGSDVPNDKCIGTIYEIGSWTEYDNDIIYICTDNNESLETRISDLESRVTNLENDVAAIKIFDEDIEKRVSALEERINESNKTNLDKVLDQTYYFTGINPKNYVKYTDESGTVHKYRILYVANDDSLVLYSDDSFGSVFEDEYTLPLTSKRTIMSREEYPRISQRTKYHLIKVSCDGQELPAYINDETGTTDLSVTTGEIYIDTRDFINTIECEGSDDEYAEGAFSFWIGSYDTSLGHMIESYVIIQSNGCGMIGSNYAGSVFGKGYYAFCGNASYGDASKPQGYKIRLKPCMEIESDLGVGSSSKPFVIKNNCI